MVQESISEVGNIAIRFAYPEHGASAQGSTPEIQRATDNIGSHFVAVDADAGSNRSAAVTTHSEDVFSKPCPVQQ